MEGVEDALRERMLDAALQLWADHGWHAVRLSTACALAGVDECQFAEEFPTTVDLLHEVFDASTETRVSAVLVALESAGDGQSRWRAAMEAYLRCVDDDPRHVVVMVDTFGCPELRVRRRSSARGFASVMANQATRSSGDPGEMRVAAHFCLGGIIELTLAWQDPATDLDRETTLELGSRLFETCMGS